MTTTGRRTVIAAAAALAVIVGAGFAAAQERVETFDQLNTRLKVGDTVWVTDTQGREIKGQIRDLSAASLLLNAGGSPQDVQAARVGTIRMQQKDSLKNGVLYGALAGAVAGVLSCMLNEQCGGDDELAARVSAVLAVVGGAAGAGIGAGVDAAIKGPRLVIYRRAGSPSASRLSLAPVVTWRHKGVALSFSF